MSGLQSKSRPERRAADGSFCKAAVARVARIHAEDRHWVTGGPPAMIKLRETFRARKKTMFAGFTKCRSEQRA